MTIHAVISLNGCGIVERAPLPPPPPLHPLFPKFAHASVLYPCHAASFSAASQQALSQVKLKTGAVMITLNGCCALEPPPPPSPQNVPHATLAYPPRHAASPSAASSKKPPAKYDRQERATISRLDECRTHTEPPAPPPRPPPSPPPRAHFAHDALSIVFRGIRREIFPPRSNCQCCQGISNPAAGGGGVVVIPPFSDIG